MKLKLLLSFLFIGFLSACANNISGKSFDYSDIEEKIFKYEDIFILEMDIYEIYFYSSFCGHCKNIKNEMIEYALIENNVYFVEFLNNIPIKSERIDINEELNIQTFYINGTPSLFRINNKKIENTYVGEKEIISYIKR